MKIAFIIEDAGYTDLDFSHPEDGNPGVSGTIYAFVMLIKYLHMLHSEIKLLVYHFGKNKLPDCEDVLIASREEALQRAKTDKVNYLIYQPGYGVSWLEALEKYQVPAIFWAHNYISAEEAEKIAKNPYVVRVVCVGRQQYDRYIDHPIIKKTEFIFNMFPIGSAYKRNRDYSLRVTYTGSLIPAKGFHLLAAVWKDILKEVPDAKLSVLGSGKLYDRNQTLGSYGIAAEKYERQFMPYLCDGAGNILPSVTFHGVMGEEKFEIYRDTAVGVCNPSALTETFGLSAAEMSACGIPVVTKGQYGMPDTVVHRKSGICANNSKALTKAIVTLLRDRNLNERMGAFGKKHIEKIADPISVTQRWHRLLCDVQQNKQAVYVRPSDHWNNDYKWLRYCNRGLRKVFPFIPSLIDVKRILRR